MKIENLKPEYIRMAFQAAAGRDLRGPAAQEFIINFLGELELTNLTPEKEDGIWKIAKEVADEVVRASKMFNPMNSPHEALGVIEEEWEEYKEEVWKYNPRKNRDTRPRQREELVQLAAMSVRAILDTIDFGKHYEAQPCSQPTPPSN
jgi:hypothetical protein